MIIVLVGMNNEKLTKYWSNLSKNLQNCSTLIGNKEWTYIDWVNQLQAFENKNVIVLDSWLTHRANARLENKSLPVTDNESMLLDRFVDMSKGHFDFITNKDEPSTLEDIEKDKGCLNEYAKKVFNEITYEVLQAKILALINPIIME